jgi:glycosyltransferase involved in cell wall biosynthesis
MPEAAPAAPTQADREPAPVAAPDTRAETHPPVKDFGVWVELPLGAVLHGQGIMVLLVNLIKAAARRGDVRVVIGCASWTEQPLLDVLEEYGVAGVEVVIVTGRKKPSPLIRLVAQFLGTRRAREPRVRPSRLRAARLWMRQKAARNAATLLTGEAYWVVLLSPVILLASVIGALAAVCFKVGRWVGSKVARVVHAALDRARTIVRSRVVTFAEEIYRHLHVDEHMLAAREGERLGVPVWLVTSPASAAAAKLKTPTVFAVADLVPIDFPLGFSKADGGAWARRVIEDIRKGVTNASATISYSEFVREEHVIRCLDVPPKKAHVVRHATPDTDDPAYENPSFARDERLLTDYLQSKPAVRSWSSAVTGGMPQHLPLARIPYLLVSSQIRPHKNVSNMIRAFEILLRRHDVDCKLVLTGDLRGWPDLQTQITSRGLEFDVLSLPSVPHAAHVALYRRAALTVVPTLFEGGFPFCFAEGMAVGTPAVMSRIPVTEETVPPELEGLMLFDPYDPEDIAEKSLAAVHNRESLYQKQLPLYEHLANRTWDVLVDEYMGVMDIAAEARRG